MSRLSPTAIRDELAAEALRLGFARVGFAPATERRTFAAFEGWLAAGHAGNMVYLAEQAVPRRAPGEVLPRARTVMAVLLAYGAGGPQDGTGRDADAASDQAPRALVGRVARYARGSDYHDLVRGRLRRLAGLLRQLAGEAVATRVAVDSAPVLERDLAAHAGLGFIGKSTQLVTPRLGSYTCLGELITDAPLPAGTYGSGCRPEGTPGPRGRCGSCARCLEACPTGALVAPYTLDARRCISYLTIELRGVVPRALRPLMGDWVVGCDRCQEVCPFNRRAPVAGDPGLRGSVTSVHGTTAGGFHGRVTSAHGTTAGGPHGRVTSARGAMAGGSRGRVPRALGTASGLAAIPLPELVNLGAAGYRKLVRGTALRRLSREQLQRNAAIALGNSGDPRAVPPLRQALSCRSLLVRAHAAWALGQLGGAAASEALAAARATEHDPGVAEELETALGG